MSNEYMGMTESVMRKSLDNLLVAGEADGHVDGNDASTVAQK